MMEFLPEVIIAVVSGIFGSGLTFLVSLRNSQRDDFGKVIESWQTLLSENQTQLKETKEEIKLIQEQNRGLRNKIEELEAMISLHESGNNFSPFPVWLKGPAPDFVMQYVNEAYEEAFNVKATEYQGKTDFEYWENQEQAQNYRDNDLLVWHTGQTWKGDESVVLDGHEVGQLWHFSKWVRYTSVNGKKIKIGIAGMAFPALARR